MFKYNYFWHYWFQLNNRHYYKAVATSLFISLLLTVFLPSLSVLAIALPLVVSGTIALFTQLSNFFYHQQNQQLTQLKAKTDSAELKQDLDLYLDRRVVCPAELLAGSLLNIPADPPSMKNTVANAPLVFETEERLIITKESRPLNRNFGAKASSESTQLYVKKVAATDGLSEVAAREMAEILGFKDLIPSNTLTKGEGFFEKNHTYFLSSTELGLSRQNIKKLIETRMNESPQQKIQNTAKVQDAVAKYLLNLKAAAYRTKAQKEGTFQLLHLQQWVPNALDGFKLYLALMNSLPANILYTNTISINQEEAKIILKNISIPSFQDHFLLHLILGSQDANPGNTLFTDGPNGKKMLLSINHEKIMPADNYNITKRIPVANGPHDTNVEDKNIENVFPIRLWLAGMPQANTPFTKEIINKTLASLNPERLLAFHRQKKLFSTAAVGAQLERILLIKEVFEKEIKKSTITLTPKELFLKFVNNHPTYLFLKKELQLSDFHTFMLLGQVPEGADLSLFRHPLRFFPMLGMDIEATQNQAANQRPYTEKSFKSAHAHNHTFLSISLQAKIAEILKKETMDFLAETSNEFRL